MGWQQTVSATCNFSRHLCHLQFFSSSAEARQAISTYSEKFITCFSNSFIYLLETSGSQLPPLRTFPCVFLHLLEHTPLFFLRPCLETALVLHFSLLLEQFCLTWQGRSVSCAFFQYRQAPSSSPQTQPVFLTSQYMQPPTYHSVIHSLPINLEVSWAILHLATLPRESLEILHVEQGVLFVSLLFLITSGTL